MSNAHTPASGRKKSGGPVKKQHVASPPDKGRDDALPPEDRPASQSGIGIAVVAKTIVVRDERGQIVSVTKVAPDAQYGVGVKPQPGQTIMEYAAGTLAEDPFPRFQKESEAEGKKEPRKK